MDKPQWSSDFRLGVASSVVGSIVIAAIPATWTMVQVYAAQTQLGLGRLGVEWQPITEGGQVVGFSIGYLLPFGAATTDLDVLRAIKAVRGAVALAATIYKRASERAKAVLMQKNVDGRTAP